MNKIVNLTAKDLKRIWNSVPPDFYSQVNKNFFQNFWHGNKLKCIRQLINKKPKKILDVGCADGSFLARLASFYPKSKFYGIDCYTRAIEYGKKKYPFLDLTVGDAHKLPFKNKSFDLVFILETLEHVIDPEKVIRELKRVIKDDGSMLVELDSNNLLFKTAWFFWTNFFKGRVWRGSHLHSFNLQELEELFERYQLKILEKKFFNLGMAVCFALKKK